MKRPDLAALALLLLAALACGNNTATPTPRPSVGIPTRTPDPSQLGDPIFDSGQTAYGFFPSPPEPTLDSILSHFQALGQHADFVLVQQNIPWEDFKQGVEGDSQKRTDLLNLMTLARQQGLEAIFVVDPLNGLNRREFMGLPAGWGADFSNPDVRIAFTNFALWIVREFHPRYLGLASEINSAQSMARE